MSPLTKIWLAVPVAVVTPELEVKQVAVVQSVPSESGNVQVLLAVKSAEVMVPVNEAPVPVV